MGFVFAMMVTFVSSNKWSLDRRLWEYRKK